MQNLRTKIESKAVKPRTLSDAERCWRWFAKFFPLGFDDPKYLDWERGYKLSAHEEWNRLLNRKSFSKLLKSAKFEEIASIAVRIESRTNLLFSFEKMALRDAVRPHEGAKIFAEGLYELLHGRGSTRSRFEKWCDAVGSLPRKQTRVLTHPLVTVFPFIADPTNHIFLKPNVTNEAARRFGFDFRYNSKPSWDVYSQLIAFTEEVRKELRSKGPRDMIDIQSFIWVIGSDEYRNMAG